MWKLLKSGLMNAWNQPFAVCALFTYNLLWGLILYTAVRSIVVPLLHRYPSPELSREAVQLFWLEGQFQITKTDLIVPYLWWALALLLIRMVLSPLLSAGIYYSLEHTELNAGYRFVRGIRKLGLPFLGLYLLQIVLTVAPLYLLGTKVIEGYHSHASLTAIGWHLLPWLGIYVAYLILIQTLFMYMQFGLASGKSVLISCRLLVRNVLTILLLAIVTMSITFTLSALVITSALVWAGFAALVLVQAYRLLHMFCKMWTITSQHALWNANHE
ncbi:MULTISPECIES: hypothetical protein [Paenibacillus]|jgi:hypothetical protein|uniref:DUF4013 domain-containing protein n=1 Tax=Paenibacillus baimaensis TaxID=2982185 RepID=A0ABT2USY2_9BACL|nr:MULTISPECIES: hypothetical protein [unclassified Paenibacillus]MCU6797181.1 hypothetical protein [Paenibacillus sp. WQ 127069]OMF03529.1 hypothetical protein BK127_35345 [Paenibacillus sp. FSL H7-0331]